MDGWTKHEDQAAPLGKRVLVCSRGAEPFIASMQDEATWVTMASHGRTSDKHRLFWWRGDGSSSIEDTYWREIPQSPPLTAEEIARDEAYAAQVRENWIRTCAARNGA